MTLKEYLISIGRAEPETIQNESGIEAPSIAPPVQAPSVNPTKKITKYKIFGITFTKTEITQ